MNSVKNIIFISIFSILCIIAVIQAGISASNIKIPIEEKDEVIWDVIFEKDEPQLFDSIVNDFDVMFKKSGEQIIYTFYINNKSEYDSFILHYNKPKISCIDNDEECIKNLDKIEYTFIYDNGKEVKLNDIIKSKEKKKVHLKITYKESNKDIEMNLTKLGLSLTFAKVK